MSSIFFKIILRFCAGIFCIHDMDESLRQHSWRGVKLCVIIQGMQWISAPSSLAWNETLHHHSWRGVWISATSYIAWNWASAPSFMAWSFFVINKFGFRICTRYRIITRDESLSHLSWYGINLCFRFHGAEWSLLWVSQCRTFSKIFRNYPAPGFQDKEKIFAPDFMASSVVDPDPAWSEIIYKLGSRFFRIRIRFRLQVKNFVSNNKYKTLKRTS